MDTKPTNPKDMIGTDKLPIHLWPMSATIGGSLALLEGMLKYGRSNWRAAGVRASIYYDALNRHITKWFEGEDRDGDSGLDHLDHALACLAILKDARAAGKFVDDRQAPGGVIDLLAAATPEVARLKAKYADRGPKHWTIADAETLTPKVVPACPHAFVRYSERRGVWECGACGETVDGGAVVEACL